MEGLSARPAGRDPRRNARLDLMETTRPRHALLCSSRAPRPSRDRVTSPQQTIKRPTMQRFRIKLELNLFNA